MLKIRCDRDELAEACGAVLSIVPVTQPPKQILVNFHLLADGTKLTVEATDLDMGARIAVERLEIEAPGELALPAQRFASLLREIPQKEVVIEGFPESNGAHVTAGDYSFRLVGEDPAEFPEIPTFTGDAAVTVPREKFVELLRRVGVAAARDPSRYQLAGVFLELDDEKLLLTATDGKRLTHDEMRLPSSSPVKARGILPNRVVDVLLKVLPQAGNEFQLALNQTDVHVEFGGGELTAKLAQGAFPDYRVAVFQDPKVKIKAQRSDLLAAARTAALMTDKETATVVFNFGDEKVSLTTKARDIGESRIEVPISSQGGPVEIRFNPTYFIDALRCLTEEEVRIEFVDGSRPGAIRGGQNYRHMLMPMVIDT